MRDKNLSTTLPADEAEIMAHDDVSKMKIAGRGLHATKMRQGYEVHVHHGKGHIETRFVLPDPSAQARVKAEYKRLKMINDLRVLREKAGLTQSELGRKVGLSKSRIIRMEDPNFEGHSVQELLTILAALGMELELRIVKKSGKKQGRRTVGAA